MAHEFVAKNGIITPGNTQITGSLIVLNGISGSLFGTASYSNTSSFSKNSTSSSYSVSASYAPTNFTQSFQVSASWASSSLSSSTSLFANQSLSASYSTTSSYSFNSLSSSFAPLQWTPGTNGAIYYNNGNVGIGIANPPTKLSINATYTSSTFGMVIPTMTVNNFSDSSNFYSLYSAINVTPSQNIGNSNFVSVIGQASGYGGTASLSNLIGLYGQVSAFGSGKYTGTCLNLRGGIEVPTASFSNMTFINVSSPYTNGNAGFTNVYGLYINPMSQSFVTNSYAIYQLGTGDTNLFNGIVRANNITGSLFGTSSFAVTSSFSNQSISASWSPVPISSSWASSSLSSSYSMTASYTINSSSNATDFSIIQFGDPQGASYFTQSIANFSSSMSWIIANKQLYNIKAVVIPGDLVDVYNTIPMWNLFITQSTRIQQAGINLILSQGNHDDNGGTTYFNTYAVPLITSDTAYKESYVNGTTSRGDVYAQVNNGVKIVYITLSFYNVTDPGLQAWAVSMGAKYYDYAIIWLIHGYLFGNNQISVPADMYYNYGDISWEKVVSQCPNSTQVMCGHIFEYVASTQDTPWGRSVSVGAGNNIVQNLRFDTQASQNNGLQYVRLYEWKPTQNLIQASTYDTQQNAWVTWNGSTFNIPIRSTYDEVSPRTFYTDNTPVSVQTNGAYGLFITELDVKNNLTANSITFYSAIACTASVFQTTGLSYTSSIVNTIITSASLNVGLNTFPISSSGTWNSGYNALTASTNWYAGTSKYIAIQLNGGATMHCWRTTSSYASNYINYSNSNFSSGTNDAISIGLTPSLSIIYEDGIRSAYFSPSVDLPGGIVQITASYALNIGQVVTSISSSYSSTSVSSSYALSSSWANFSPVSRPDLNNGLFLNLPLNEGSGSTVHDYSSTQCTGTYGAAPGFTPLINNWNTSSYLVGGSSILFNASQSISSSYSYVQLNVPTTLGAGLNKMTLACWFNTTQSLSTGEQIFFAKFNGGADGTMFLGFNNSTNQILVGAVSSVPTRYNIAPSIPYNITDGNWHLMSATHNGSTGTQNVYLDGKLISTQNLFTGSLFTSTAPIILGNYATSGAGFAFSGSLQNAKMWSRDLSAVENSLLYTEFMNQITSSYSTTSSYSSNTVSSSYALTASFSLTGSRAITSSFAITSSNSVTSSYSVTSSFAGSSSYAPYNSNTLLAVNNPGVNYLSGSLIIGSGSNSVSSFGSAEFIIVQPSGSFSSPKNGLLITNPGANPTLPNFGLTAFTSNNSAYLGLSNGGATLGFGNPVFGSNMTLDFTNVGIIQNFPYLLPFQTNADGFWIPPGLTGSALIVSTGNSTLTIGANQITDNLHSAVFVGRGMQRASYTTSSTSANRGFCFNDISAFSSSWLSGMNFYKWATADHTLMTLSAFGQLSCSVVTASLLLGTASFALNAAPSVSSSYALTASFSNQSISASYAPFTQTVQISGSWASASLSSSYVKSAVSSSVVFNPSGSVAGDFGGFYVRANNSLIMVANALFIETSGGGYTSIDGVGNTIIATNRYPDGLLNITDAGMTAIGDLNQDENGTYISVDDTAQQITMNGPTVVQGSLYTTNNTLDDNLGNVIIKNNLTVKGNSSLTGSLQGTSSYALTSSFARTASYAPTSVSSSYSLTSSFVKNAISSSALFNPSGSINGVSGFLQIISKGTMLLDAGDAFSFQTNGGGYFSIDSLGDMNLATFNYPDGLFILNNGGQVAFGDYNGDNNNTYILVDDSTQTVMLNVDNTTIAGSLIVYGTIQGNTYNHTINLNDGLNLDIQGYTTANNGTGGTVNISGGTVGNVGGGTSTGGNVNISAGQSQDDNGNSGNVTISSPGVLGSGNGGNINLTTQFGSFGIDYNGNVTTKNSTYLNGLISSDNSGFASLGDAGGNVNSTYVAIYDSTETVVISGQEVNFGVNQVFFNSAALYNQNADYFDSAFNYYLLNGNAWNIIDGNNSKTVFRVQSTSNGGNGSTVTLNNTLDDGTGNMKVSGSLVVTGSFTVRGTSNLTGSLSGTASYALTSSYSPNYVLLSGSSGINAGSASFTITSLGNTAVTGTLKTTFTTLDDGTGTSNFVNSSVAGQFSVGTTNFKVLAATVTTTNNTLDDGSGNVNIKGRLYVTGSITGSLAGTASFANKIVGLNGTQNGNIILSQDDGTIFTTNNLYYNTSSGALTYLGEAHWCSNGQIFTDPISGNQAVLKISNTLVTSSAIGQAGTAILMTGTGGANVSSYGAYITNNVVSSGSGVSYGVYVTANKNYFSGNITASAITSSFTGSLYGTASFLNPYQPYSTIVTSSTQWITASLSSVEQYVNITTGSLYNFTCSNVPPSGSMSNVNLFINNTAVNTSSLAFPSSWIFIGSVPLSLSSSKSGILSLKSFGNGQIVAAWGSQF